MRKVRRWFHYLRMSFLIRNFNMHNDKRRASIIRRRFLRPYISSGKRRQSGFKITRARAGYGKRGKRGTRRKTKRRTRGANKYGQRARAKTYARGWARNFWR